MHISHQTTGKSCSDKIGKGIRVLGASLGVLLLCLPAFSQANLGRIVGAVTDQSGGAVAEAMVTVTDVQRGISRALTTDSDGGYSAPNLIPGSYSVRVEAKGFNTVQRQDIVVEVGTDVRVDLTLQPGSQAQVVTVTGEPPMIDTQSATLGGIVENQAINELPLNGRNYQELLSYKPGIEARPGGGTGAYITNGGRSEYNVWLLDGLYNDQINSGWSIVGGPGQAGESMTILPLDAIQEVNVEQNPKAELGWKPGAQVNVGLKSGTNSLHGTGFASGRDTSLDARNPFFPTPAQLAMEQFGGSIGGPIKKDKLFYFGAYEGQRYAVGNPSTITVPSTEPSLGVGNSLPDAINAMNAAGHHLSQLSLNLAGCNSSGVCNAANGVFGNSGSVNEPVSFSNTGGSNNAIEKVDYRINDHNMLNGEYYYGRGLVYTVSSAIVEPYWRTRVYTNAQVARAVEIWTPNSTWLNEARFGFDHVNIPNLTGDCYPLGQPNYASLGLVTGLTGPQSCGFPIVSISGFTPNLGVQTVRLNLSNTYQFADSVSYTRGKHLIKFGGEFRRTEWTGGTFSTAKGELIFGSGGVSAFPGATGLEDFLAGSPNQAQVLIGNVQRTIANPAYAGFVQDDWRISPRVTINLGMRYELIPPISEKNNLLGNFTPSQGLLQTGIQINTLYKTDPDNVAPRLGIAWDVTGTGRTVVRAAAGVFYVTEEEAVYVQPVGHYTAATGLNGDPTGATLYAANGSILPSPGNIAVGGLVLNTTPGNPPTLPAGINWTAGTPIFSNVTSGIKCGNGIGTNPQPCPITAINQNIRNAYVTEWNVGFEHAFTNSLSLDASYVGNHATHLWGVIDENSATPGSNATAAEQLRRPLSAAYPYLSAIIYISDNLESNYDGLQATLTKRVSRGLSFTGGYTYSHALDNSSSDMGQNVPMESAKPGLDYGASNYDIRNRFTFTASYVLPERKAPLQMLQGWQINSIVNLVGALPFNATDTTTDISGSGDFNDRWDLIGSPNDFKLGGPSAIPCYGALGSSFSKAGCAALPAACTSAASALGPATMTSLNTYGCYMEGSSVIIPPAQGTFGTMGRNVLRDKGLRTWDLSVFKNWKFKERLTSQFRAEAFNILNRTQYGNANNVLTTPTTFGEALGTPDVINHNPLIGSGSARAIQLSLKLIF
jgi:hypothetical protein